MKFPRYFESLERYLKPGKVLIIYGPRRVGKTTLLESFLSPTKFKYRFDSGDNLSVQNILGSSDFNSIKEYAEGYELIVIDEAQRIKNIGQGLKILVDQVPKIKVIATGSSSFELAGQVGEPLTGRKITLILYPLSLVELKKNYNSQQLKEKLGQYLVFGKYPEVLSASKKDEKKRLLEEIMNSYLLKDILELEKVKASKILLDLLRLLSYQVGNEVSLTELAKHLGIDYKTVARYIDLFEKSFVIFNLRGFSRNLRKEIYKKSKYYFFDNGVRNAIISNFNHLEIRNDIGQLWENYIFIERMKKRAYKNIYANIYFWRTWDKKEIDLIEEREGRLYGYEFKWVKSDVKAPKEWKAAYKEASFKVITKDNFLNFAV